jgi:DNA processing protein
VAVEAKERQAWICLASVVGVGPETTALLLAHFGRAGEVLAAAANGRLAAWSRKQRDADGRPPLTGPVLRNLAAAARDPEERLRGIATLGLWTFTPLDADYPPRLRDLDPPPAVIHGLGDPRLLFARRSVAVVGTRRPTPAGRALASRICSRLVESKSVVISGLAVGIDGAAHAATLERNGQTVGVIGGGHLHPGPRANAELRQQMVAGGGAIVTEHHPATSASQGTYPRRNKIIAALADAVIVVEAPIRSGALITARHALDLGRLVLVAPGRVGDWSVAGGLRLLRDSPARLIVGLDELSADLGYLDRPSGEKTANRELGGRQPALDMLGDAERAVARRLCVSPAGLDVIVADTGLPPAVVSGAVTLLQLRGWVQSVGPAYLPAGPLAE